LLRVPLRCGAIKLDNVDDDECDVVLPAHRSRLPAAELEEQRIDNWEGDRD